MKQTLFAILLSIFAYCAVAQSPCRRMPTMKDIDGNTYATVQIGRQCWMRENIRSTHDKDGNLIELGSNLSYDAPYRYYPDSSYSNVEKYGYLYNWEAAIKVCPLGWHLPSQSEFQTLAKYCSAHFAVGENPKYNAKSLASQEGWCVTDIKYTAGKEQYANNASGFSAFPAGVGDNTCYHANLWCSTQCAKYHAYAFIIYYDDPEAIAATIDIQKEEYMSVRCIRD